MVPFSFGPSTVRETAVDALFDEGFFQCIADFIILDREDARSHFDESDLGAERVVNVGELNADRACTDDDQLLRLL